VNIRRTHLKALTLTRSPLRLHEATPPKTPTQAPTPAPPEDEDGPPPKEIKIPVLPPDELPRKEKPIKKMTPEQRRRSLLKSAENRRVYIQKIIRDYYGMMPMTRRLASYSPKFIR